MANKIKSNVANFYVGKTIFLTGGTGFLGKTLIEKILYSCPDVNKIYVLVRESEGRSGQEKIEQLLTIPIFKRLEQRPNCLKKVIALEGDASKKNLGLTDETIKKIQDEVSIVFHLAATVNFTAPLKEVLILNFFGTTEVIKLCRKFKKIEAFVHVSTAFSNADRLHIDEVIYPSPDFDKWLKNSKELRDISEFQLDDNNNKSSILIGKKPNNYTFAKALAEEYISKTCNEIPTAIVRPSIIISSLREPSPGWIDSWNGASGILIGMATGFLRVAIGKDKNITDIIPVDIVTNLLIVAATQCKRSKKLTIYNCCTGASNPVSYLKAKIISARAAVKYSLTRWPFLFFISNMTLYNILRFILQTIPSYILDMYLRCTGRPTQFVRLHKKFGKIIWVTRCFMLNEWDFVDENVRNLWKSISETDKELFNFDVKSIEWEQCLDDFVLGAKTHLLKKKY